MTPSYATRRRFIQTMTLGAVACTTPGLFAEQLTPTPRQTEGPFYPDRLPLDTDNDLLILNDSITPAVGEITHLTGRILGANGEPIRNATIEIWQVDGKGSYLHSRGAVDERDTNFQGFGRFLTGSKGEYYFRTIKPVPYPGRTPHIHVIVNKGDKRLLTTQMYVSGEPSNRRDQIYQSVRDPKARESITVAFNPIKDSAIGELAANFDIVIGTTPEDTSATREPRRR